MSADPAIVGDHGGARERLWSMARRTLITFVAGLAVIGLMRIPVVEQSLLGEPDRAMLDTAFKLRADIYSGAADPVIFLDIDDRTLTGEPSERNIQKGPPPSVTPRNILVRLLDYVRSAPHGQRPAAVLMDVDIATPAPGEEEATRQLGESLAAWSRDPGQPTLVIAREAYPAEAVGVPGRNKVLPASPFDGTVENAPNIFWGSVKTLSDKEGRVRWFVPFECVTTPHGQQVLYSSAVLTYGALNRGLPPTSEVAKWMEEAPHYCREHAVDPFFEGGMINYHIALDREGTVDHWPDLPKDYRIKGACGDGDRSMFRRISAADIIAAGPEASASLLCGHLVVIGGTNTAASDFRTTPIGDVSGSVILVNAIRGMQLTGGGLHQLSLPFQIVVVLLVSVIYSSLFAATEHLRERVHASGVRHKTTVLARVQQMIANPALLNAMIAVMIHGLGLLGLMLSLRYGLFGFLSAPAIAAGFVETVQEFRREE